jgi:2-oxoglutarate ferredoxin oxidoreductase subunit alpha
VRELQLAGTKVSLAHFNYIKPLPSNTASVFANYKKIVVCELNLGQFVSYLRDKMPDFKYHQFNKVQGLPFTIQELSDHFIKLIAE